MDTRSWALSSTKGPKWCHMSQDCLSHAVVLQVVHVPLLIPPLDPTSLEATVDVTKMVKLCASFNFQLEKLKKG